jgi:hypothetical protein
LPWHDQVVRTKPDIGWLTIRLTEPSIRGLNATLTAIVKRAHACGLQAATIAHPPGELPAPRQMSVPTMPTQLPRQTPRQASSQTPRQASSQTPSQVPAQMPRQISLPDGVSGTVTVADEHAKLREFIGQISDLLGSDATVEIDGAAVALQRQPVGS